jgi:hypothetical protein
MCHFNQAKFHKFSDTPIKNFHMRIFDWGIAKSIKFGLVETVRFVPNSPAQAPKIAKLRHCDAEKCECDVISQNNCTKNSKNRISQYFATKTNCNMCIFVCRIANFGYCP